MRNTCAQSGKCQYCRKYIERMTPVQFFDAIEDTANGTKCAKSPTERHVLQWKALNATTSKTQAIPTGLQSAPSIRRRSLLDTAGRRSVS
jgi:hypothetical protein